jgi:hypothetical protein
MSSDLSASFCVVTAGTANVPVRHRKCCTRFSIRFLAGSSGMGRIQHQPVIGMLAHADPAAQSIWRPGGREKQTRRIERAADFAGPTLVPAEVQISANGGWFTRQVTVRPKARFFTFLSIVWLAVVGFGLFLFWSGPTNDFSAWHWLYAFPVLPEPALIALAILFWLIEEPRSVSERYPNPHFDLQKLY